jgi:hypothetical protein
MNSNRFLTVLVSLLVVSPAFAAPGHSTRIYLTRPFTNPPDLDAKGSLTVRDLGSHQRFELRVRDVFADAQLSLFVADETDTPVFVSALPAGSSRKLLLDTLEGDPMPLGLTLAELAGHAVQVVDGSDLVVLQTVVPEIAVDPGTTVANKVMEVNPDSPFPGAWGKMHIVFSKQSGVQSLRLRMSHVGFGSYAYTLWVEDEKGQMVEAGPIEKLAKTIGRFRANTALGEPLPLNATSLAELAGRTVEVRNQDGDVRRGETVRGLL